MKQCFTCANKKVRQLTKEERKPFGNENEYSCGVSGKVINQTDPECEHYTGNPTLETVRESLRQFAKKELQKLKEQKEWKSLL